MCFFLIASSSFPFVLAIILFILVLSFRPVHSLTLLVIENMYVMLALLLVFFSFLFFPLDSQYSVGVYGVMDGVCVCVFYSDIANYRKKRLFANCSLDYTWQLKNESF